MFVLDWLVLLTLILGPALLGTWRGWLAWRTRRRHLHGQQHDLGDDHQHNHKAGTPPPSRSMGVLTTGLSLLASNLSGITLLGYPAEVYRYGLQFGLIAAGAVLATAALSVAYLPVLHALRLASSYEYLELRFDSRVRKLASILYTCRLLLLLPLVLYVPALAFNQVTGVSIHLVAPAISLVCILYTTVGGLRTVALTGSLQLVVLVVSTVVLLIVGLVDVGGPALVWRRMQESHRLEFLNLDPDPRTRTTFWSATFGGAFFWLQMLAVQPNSVQRYLSVPTLRAARRTAFLQCAGLVVTTALTCLLGAVLYAKYADCDPLATKEVLRADQLVAFMVAQTSARLPGLAGLFLSGLLSAAMGNLSAALDTLSCTLYADLVSGWVPDRVRAKSVMAVRVLGVLIGIWATLLVFVVEHLGGLVQVAMSLGSVTSGTMLGLFTLGMLVPRANSLGALAGAVISLLGTALIVAGQQVTIASGLLSWPSKPTSVEGCNATTIAAEDITITTTAATAIDSGLVGEVLSVLRVSYLWLVLLGTALTLLAGVLVSVAVAVDEDAVDPALLFAFCRRRSRRRAATSPPPPLELDLMDHEKSSS